MMMRIVHDLAQVRPDSRSHVTIGVFDGVHRGHQRLITSMVEAAHSTHSAAVVLTFDPHPAATLGYEPPPLLTTVEERVELLATLGLDVLVMLPFTPVTARTSATDFVEVLMRHLHLTKLWGGPDFAIGHRCEGNIPFLRRLGSERGFTVRIVEPLVWEGGMVSSSRVRAALQAGDISQATGCLGRLYRLAGVVVRGRGLGHSIGAPTANLSLPSERLIPASGVYVCRAHIEHLGTYPAVTNVGTRPTFGGTAEGQMQVVEAHLLDFDADLYDQVVGLDFIARLRDERTFPTVSALVAQIHNDIAEARIILDGDVNPAIDLLQSLDLEGISQQRQQHG
jgi:riboflavin kinase/FMN adenylyltransferase